MKLQNDILTLRVHCRNTSIRCHSFSRWSFCRMSALCDLQYTAVVLLPNVGDLRRPTVVAPAQLRLVLSRLSFTDRVRCRRTYQRLFCRLFAPSTHLFLPQSVTSIQTFFARKALQSMPQLTVQQKWIATRTLKKVNNEN